jgi:hypothetical protein
MSNLTLRSSREIRHDKSNNQGKGCIITTHHVHQLKVQKRVFGEPGWICDGCLAENPAGELRYHCFKGCDFDLCGSCVKKVSRPIGLNSVCSIRFDPLFSLLLLFLLWFRQFVLFYWCALSMLFALMLCFSFYSYFYCGFAGFFCLLCFVYVALFIVCFVYVALFIVCFVYVTLFIVCFVYVALFIVCFVYVALFIVCFVYVVLFIVCFVYALFPI